MSQAHHPIIALWSHPRSMSTATERIMRERGDLTCFHEPFLADYYLNRSTRMTPHFDEAADIPKTYEDARAALLEAASERPVFLKDMSYYVVPHLFEDVAFAERVTHTFLIRDPRRSIASYYKLDPEFSSVEAGLVAQLEHVRWLEEKMGDTPFIVEAEAIQDDPRGAITSFWAATGLTPKLDALEWKTDDTPEDWKRVEDWHGSASQSTGIRTRDNAPSAQEVFSAAAENAPHLHDVLNEHWPAYVSLRDRARVIASADHSSS